MAYAGRGDNKKVLTAQGLSANSKFDYPAWVRLDTQTASASANIDFTSFADPQYKTYVVILEDIVLSGGSNLEMEISDNGGASWLNFGYESGDIFIDYNSASWTNQNISSAFQLYTGASSTTSGQLYINNLDTSNDFSIYGFMKTQSAIFELCVGRHTFVTLVNALRFIPISPNTITSGKFTLYGIFTG